MLDAIKELSNLTYTENGALTYRSTTDRCLDLFASIGAMRRLQDEEICNRFLRAYAEDPDLAMKTLFYARDVRGGLGERRVFRVILQQLAQIAPASVCRNLAYVAEYGRWDDLLCFIGTPCEDAALALIKQQLELDQAALAKGEVVSLLGKWLPSINASNEKTVGQAKHIAKRLDLSSADYRRMLTALRAQIRIIENDLRQRDYTFRYEKQPSGAMFKYRKAFIRNDEERYMQYLADVAEGKTVMHTDTLLPYQIIEPIFRQNIDEKEAAAMDVTWNALPDFAGAEDALVVVDGSGSMYGYGDPKPASVALSLGIYFAQRNKGAFRNHFITFSENPQLVEIKGSNIVEQVRYCASYNEVANTNIQKVFELLLQAALRKKASNEDMPRTIYIISDMEFDACARGAQQSNFDRAKKIFAEYGYELPRIVFWNVASRAQQMPVTKNERGVALISGCTPRIFSMVAEDQLDPMAYMRSILESARYEKIAA